MKNKMRKSGLSDPELNERQKKAFKYLQKHKSMKAQTYAELNHVSHATAVSEINELVEFGYLKKVGAFGGAYYVLNEETRWGKIRRRRFSGGQSNL